MKIPAYFQEKISRSFQEKGIRWLEQLPSLIQECAEQWQLSQLETADGLSYNYVAFAQHPAHGRVALKIGVPHLDLFSDMEAITLFDGKGLCQCYATDHERGAMLLERILPGGDLRKVTQAEERFQILAGLYQQIEVLPPANCTLPLFGTLIRTAIERSQTMPHVPQNLRTWLTEIEQRYETLAAGQEAVVLHCDLHHMNIMQDGSDWRIIDPKGFVGVRAIEAARFIENEMHFYPTSSPLESLDQMLTTFAPALKRPKAELAEGLFIDQVLNTFWWIEDHASAEDIQFNIAEIEQTLIYLQHRI